MSASVEVSRVAPSFPEASAWISRPGIAAIAARTAVTLSGRTWITRLETCASGRAGATRRPLRSSRRDGRSAALIARSHRPGRSGEHVVHPDEEPPSGHHADSDERPDHYREQQKQEPLAPAPRAVHRFRSHQLPRVPFAMKQTTAYGVVFPARAARSASIELAGNVRLAGV